MTARVARRAELRHALALGVVQLIIGILVQVQYWQVMPLWYHLSFLSLLLPGTVLGGRWRARQVG